MIYFGKKKLSYFKISIEFVRRMTPAIFNTGTKRRRKKILNTFIVLGIGNYNIYVGINRFKRIVKNEIYELDGIMYYNYKEILEKRG